MIQRYAFSPVSEELARADDVAAWVWSPISGPMTGELNTRTG